MRNACLALPFAMLALLAGPAWASVEVRSADFSVERIAGVTGNTTPRLEVVRNAEYGEGILGGTVRDGKLVIQRLGSDSPPLAVLGPFNAAAELMTLRFDPTGQFGRRLLVSVAHDAGLGGENVVSSLYSIGADGAATLLQSLGSKQNPVHLNFAISDGSRGYRSGLYLQDRNIKGGSSLYHMTPDLQVTVIGTDFVPKGRRDIDIRSMRFDPTGLYSSYLYFADADDHDKVSALYLLDPRLRWTEVTPVESLRRVAYADLAFSAGGPLDLALYVAETVRNRILTVSPTGAEADFATGFNRIESISISDDGRELYAADRDAVYRIRSRTDEAATP